MLGQGQRTMQTHICILEKEICIYLHYARTPIKGKRKIFSHAPTTQPAHMCAVKYLTVVEGKRCAGKAEENTRKRSRENSTHRRKHNLSPTHIHISKTTRCVVLY